MTKILKGFGIAIYVALLLFGVWLFVSFVDVISHNLDSCKNYAEYLDWNFFVVLENLIRG